VVKAQIFGQEGLNLSWKKMLIGFRPIEKLRKKQEREDATMKWNFFFLTIKMKLLAYVASCQVCFSLRYFLKLRDFFQFF
jgi:hypothetical protein